MVVDLWGGYSDSDSDRKWAENTMSVAYSSTKAVSALCVAMLVDRGLLSYDDLITKYWPEFGKHGKEKATVKMLVSHELGLVALDEPITYEAAKDWRKLSAMLENQIPNWEVGTATGYHMTTFLMLCDQLIRRVDTKKRSLGRFLRDEIAEPYDIDFYIGLPSELEYRVARLKRPSIKTLLQYSMDFEVLANGYHVYSQSSDSITKKALRNPRWLEGSRRREIVHNNPDFHALDSFTGIGTARALAKLFCVVDSGKLINRTTIENLLKPIWVDTVEQTFRTPVTWGWGFFHTKNPEGNYQIGHPGYGGQYVRYDPHNKLSYAYLRNGLIYTGGKLQAKSFITLEKAVYEVLQKKR